MKYKVGDKVRIKSKEWWDAQPKDLCGSVRCGEDKFNSSMTFMCGKIARIEDISEGLLYHIEGFGYNWTDDMIECLVSDTPEKSIISTDLIKDIAEVIKSHNLGVSVSENEGKLIIEPLKVNGDLPIDTPCMVSDDGKTWHLQFYAGLRSCFCDGKKSSNYDSQITYNIIIPFDKFDPNDIEESLKYNIVK